MGDRLQRQPSPHAATAFQPTTNNKCQHLRPTQNGRAAKGPPTPRAGRLGRLLLWMVDAEAGPGRVPPAFGQCRSGAGEPRWPGKPWVSPCQPFSWFAWLQRARAVSRWLFGFVGCVGQRPARRRRGRRDGLVSLVPLGEAVDLKGGFPPAPARASCADQAPQAPSPPHAGGAACRGACPLPLQGLLVEFRFRFQCRLVFGCVPCLLCWGGRL